MQINEITEEDQAILARLLVGERARFEVMLVGLSPEASDRVRLQPEIKRIEQLYNKVSNAA